MELAGKRVLVTGASRGIGQALAERFTAAGARVALVARSEGPLKELADRLGGTAHPADLADRDQLDGLIERIEADGGPVDVLVNNAGVDRAGFLVEMSADDVDFLYRLNLVAPVELCRQILPRMLERGAGHIVTISSMAGVGSYPGYALYASSKAALNHFTACLRADLKGKPVGTTLVEVAFVVPTEMADNVKQNPGIAKAADRFYKLHTLTDVPIQTLTTEVVDAVRRGRRHVRLPRRLAPLSLLGEAPRRSVEMLLTGVRWQED
jgi:short-subunit dehydrogenase